MALVLDLPQPVEARLEAEAQKAGVSLAEYAARLFVQNFAPPALDPEEEKQINAPTIALLDSWLETARKPRTMEELRAAEDDLDAFKRSMNALREEAGERLLYPEVEEKGGERDEPGHRS